MALNSFLVAFYSLATKQLMIDQLTYTLKFCTTHIFVYSISDWGT